LQTATRDQLRRAQSILSRLQPTANPRIRLLRSRTRCWRRQVNPFPRQLPALPLAAPPQATRPPFRAWNRLCKSCISNANRFRPSKTSHNRQHKPRLR